MVFPKVVIYTMNRNNDSTFIQIHIHIHIQECLLYTAKCFTPNGRYLPSLSQVVIT